MAVKPDESPEPPPTQVELDPEDVDDPQKIADKVDVAALKSGDVWRWFGP